MSCYKIDSKNKFKIQIELSVSMLSSKVNSVVDEMCQITNIDVTEYLLWRLTDTLH